MLNTLAKIDEYCLNEKLYNKLKYLKKIGYSGEYDNLNYDATYKWAKILYCLDEVLDENKYGLTYLDIGGGISPIHYVLSTYGKVYNLDFSFDGWFPTKNGYYTKINNEFKKLFDNHKKNIEYIQGDINETIKNIETNSIDCMVDGCSVIHMLNSFKNKDLIKEIERVLKPNAVFISVCDILNPFLSNYEDCEFFYPNNLINFFHNESKLKLIQPYDYDNWEEKLKTKKEGLGIGKINLCKEIFINPSNSNCLTCSFRILDKKDQQQVLWVGTFVYRNLK